MQFKSLIIALMSFSAIAIAAPADAATEEVNTQGLTQADLDFCDRYDRRWERRDCREDRRYGRCYDRPYWDRPR